MEGFMTMVLLVAVIAAIIFITAVWKIHPLPVLLLGGFCFGLCHHTGFQNTLELIATGFGNTIKNIGLVIIAGTIIGVFMEKRGALMVIARKIIALTGEKRTPLAMAMIGYVVSICIFCDSAFIILVGLWKKISRITRIPAAVGATALSMGLFASHCFIPPTPGPLAAMVILGADFGRVLLYGSAAALAAAAAGYFYSLYAGKNEILEADAPATDDDPGGIPFRLHWSVAFLPIAVPLLLIEGNSLAGIFKAALPPAVTSFLACAGHPVTALTVGAFIAVFLLGKCRQDELSAGGLMGKAVLDAANILVITAAGGAFGEVLKQVDFAAFIPAGAARPGIPALLFPLIFAAVLKMAQGSSTLAILTAASVTAPLLEPLGMTSPSMRALACCAVCCGGMIVSHTNDSFFWIVTRFSGMNVRQGLKLQTLGTLFSGLAGAVVILLLAIFVRAD